jgi:hypothetical protein
MTTQTNLTLEQLPYGYEAGLVTDLIALPGKLFRAIGAFFTTLDEAIELRNRYADLESIGVDRATIAKTIAQEAGLFGANPVAHNSNERVRSAA